MSEGKRRKQVVEFLIPESTCWEKIRETGNGPGPVLVQPQWVRAEPLPGLAVCPAALQRIHSPAPMT